MTKNKNVILALIFSVMIIIPCLLPAVSQAGLLFLTIEPSARANGMGRAYSAVVDDAYAGWWNPGAMAFNRKNQFAGNHTPWLQGAGGEANDIFHEYFGYNVYLEGMGNLGFNVVWMDLGSQMQTDEFGNEKGEFHSFEVASGASYGYDVIPNRLGVGATFKLIYSYLGPATGASDTEGSAFSFAFDVGTKVNDLIIPNLDGALVIQNIGPNVTYVNQAQSDDLPMTFRAGLAYTLFDSSFSRLMFSAEASKILATDKDDSVIERFVTGWDPIGDTIYAAGAEFKYLNLLSLRGGWFHDEAGSITGPSFGVGLQYAFAEQYKFSVDFGMIVGGELVDYNKFFSLGLEF